MGWLSRLGGLIVNGNGAGEKLLDSGIKGIDALVLTKEEKLKHQKAHFAKWQELQLKLAERGTGTAINRRIVSWFVILNVTGAFWLCTGLSLAGLQIQTIIDLADKFWIGEAFVAVIGFYFGPHLIRD